VGNIEWPESVEYTFGSTTTTQPAPTRYMVVSQQSILAFPTVSVSYAVIPDELSIGAGFIWGIARASFTSFTETTSPAPPRDDFQRDAKAELTAEDYFVPGFVIGVNWRASKNLDVGGWFKWSDKISTDSTTLQLDSNYWTPVGTVNENRCTGQPADCNTTLREDAGTFELNIPMEAKFGVRYHHPLKGDVQKPKWATRPGEYVRDPLTEDRFDVEVDLTYSNTKSVDAVRISFVPGIAVKGTPGEVPTNGDIPHEWSDILGIRWGGDVTVIPNLLALRAGGWFESKAQADELANIDFQMGWKAGIGAGGTVRVGPADIHLAYQHVFFGTLDNGGQGQLKGLSGDATSNYRTLQSVNGGSFASQINEVAAGATFRF
jgi:hypothetical protein